MREGDPDALAETETDSAAMCIWHIGLIPIDIGDN